MDITLTEEEFINLLKLKETTLTGYKIGQLLAYSISERVSRLKNVVMIPSGEHWELWTNSQYTDTASGYNAKKLKEENQRRLWNLHSELIADLDNFLQTKNGMDSKVSRTLAILMVNHKKWNHIELLGVDVKVKYKELTEV